MDKFFGVGAFRILNFRVAFLQFFRPENGNELWLLLIGVFFLTTVISLVFLCFQMGKSLELHRAENTVYIEMMGKQKQYYETMLRADTETRAFRHDMQGHVLCLRRLLELGETAKALTYIEHATDKLESLYGQPIVENLIVDILARDVVRKHSDVELRWEGEIPAKIPIRDCDLCILFSNLFKNALQALGEEKWIAVRVKTFSHGLYIWMQNPNPKEFHKEKGTSFGTQNMKRVAESYNGYLELLHKDPFVAEVVLFFDNKKDA